MRQEAYPKEHAARRQHARRMPAEGGHLRPREHVQHRVGPQGIHAAHEVPQWPLRRHKRWVQEAAKGCPYAAALHLLLVHEELQTELPACEQHLLTAPSNTLVRERVCEVWPYQ